MEAADGLSRILIKTIRREGLRRCRGRSAVPARERGNRWSRSKRWSSTSTRSIPGSWCRLSERKAELTEMQQIGRQTRASHSGADPRLSVIRASLTGTRGTAG